MMRALAGLALFLASLAHAAPLVRVTLAPAAVVSGASVALGSVARLDGPEDVVAQIGRVAVAPAPRPGYATDLARPALERLVRSRFPEWADRIEWDGARAVKVEVATATLAGATLAQAAAAHVRATLAPRFARLEAEVVEPVADATLPAGAIELRPRPLDSARVARRELAWIDLLVDGRFQRAVAVPVQVAAYAEVAIARDDLAAGHLPRAEDFERRLVDVAPLAGEPAEARQGSRLKRAVRKDAVLLEQDLERRPAVARGEPVTLVVASAAVRIETRVTALADAAVGQPVWVRREPAGESLQARVVSPGHVEVTAP